MEKHRLKAYGLLLIVAVIWGIAGPAIKLTLGSLPAGVFLLYRFLISSIIAIPILFINRERVPTSIGVWLEIFIYGFLTSTLALGLLFLGTEKTTLLDMSLISVFAPIVSIIAGLVFLKEHITRKEKVGIFVAFIGSLFIIAEPFLGPSRSADGRILGNILIFASLLAGAGSAIMAKKLLRKGISPSFLTNSAFIIGFITTLPVVLLSQSLPNILNTIYNTPLLYHLGVFYMAIFSGTIAYTLLNMAQKTIEVSEAALSAYVYPVFSAILAVIFLGDKLTIPAIIGSSVTFVGVFLAEYKRKLRTNS